jgi:hypothetical protein
MHPSSADLTAQVEKPAFLAIPFERQRELLSAFLTDLIEIFAA